MYNLSEDLQLLVLLIQLNLKIFHNRTRFKLHNLLENKQSSRF